MTQRVVGVTEGAPWSPRCTRALAILVVALLPGCASLPFLGGEAGGPLLGREIRPDAPAEYDVLVALEHDREGRLPEAVEALERAVEKDPRSGTLHLMLAEALWRSSRFDEAVTHAEEALALDAEAHEARVLLAQLHRLRRDPEAARAVLLDPDGVPYDDEGAFLLWQISLESGHMQEALELASWMVEADPLDVRARVALANVYENLGRSLEAEEVLREALRLDAGNLQLYRALATSKRQRGDREGEIEIYREILELHPGDHGSLVALADAQSESDLGGAIETLEQIERLHPEDLRSTIQLAFLLYEARRFGAAAERFARVRAERPGEDEIAFYHGVSAAQAHDTEQALEAFLAIPPGHQSYPDARVQIATLYEREGDYARALEEVERALSLAPARDLELYAATLRAKTGDFDGAVAYLEALIEARPGDAQLLYNLGVVYGEAKRVDEAITYMQQALEVDPDNASALNYVGYTWAERGERLDEAEAMIERAIELRPEDGYIVDSLGWVYYMRARPLVEAGERERAQPYIDRAFAALRRADELSGGDPVISEHIGDIHLLLGDREQALAYFEEAYRLGVREAEQPDLMEKLETLRRELH